MIGERHRRAWAALAAVFVLTACELNRTPGDSEISEGEGSFTTDTSGVIGTTRDPLVPRVIITPPAPRAPDAAPDDLCGNGRVDPGEACDVALHDCCRSDCSEASAAGELCRAQDGPCDAEERCDGSAVSCPDDAVAAADSECRPSAADCDAAELCDGESKACPEDAPAAAGTVCRQPLETCDRFAACDGQSMECPAFTLTVAPANTPCRAAAGDCDPAEVCDGVTTACPPDQLAPASTPCRAVAGDCDVVETCSGNSAACPADVVLPAASVCRGSAGDCDVVETCNGASPACPTDAFLAAGSECRAATLACDVAESCNGRSAACPADAVLPRGTVCSPSRGECDADEVCPGPGAGGNLCPPEAITDGRACHAGRGMCWAGTCCPGATRDAGNGCQLTTGEHIVFVTSRDIAGGAIGGLARADALCDEIAGAANLAGTYTAWLSNDPQGRAPANAVDRIAAGVYALVDGTKVADDKPDLDRTLDAAIALSEWGEARAVPVWTGTNTSGSGIVGATCGDWADLAARGELGRSGAFDPGWTMFEALSCDAPFALYCIQD